MQEKHKMIFLQDLIKTLQENNNLAIFNARFLQDFYYVARKVSFLMQDLQECARFNTRFCNSCKKNCKTCIILATWFY